MSRRKLPLLLMRLGFYASLVALATCLVLPMLTEAFGNSGGLTNLGLSVSILFFATRLERKELSLAWLGAMVCWPGDVYYGNDYVFTLVPQMGLLVLAWNERAQFRGVWDSFGPERLLLAAYFAWSAVSVFGTSQGSFWELGHELALFAAAMTVWSLWGKSPQALLVIFGVAALGMGVVLLYAFAISPFEGKAATYPFYNNANYFSGLLSLALPFVGYQAYLMRGKWRIAVTGGVLFMLVSLLVLQSRGAWLGLLGGLGLGTLVYVQRRGLRLAILVLGLSSLTLFFLWGKQTPPLAAPQNGWEKFLSISDVETNFSNRERLMRWKTAWRMAMDEPWQGIGPGNFIREFKYHLESTEEVEQISYWEGWNGYGHSEYLTRLAERGFPGVLAFIGFLGWLLYHGLSLRSENVATRLWKAVAMAALGTWLVHGIFNDLSLDNRVMLMVFVLVVALMDTSPGTPGQKADIPQIDP